MVSLATSIEIDAPASLVWQVLADWAAYPRWNPFVAGLHGRQQPGARLVVSLHPPHGGRFTFRPTLLRFTPGHEFAWRGQLWLPALFAGEHYFALDSLDSGRCRLRHGETFSGLLGGLMRGRWLQQTRLGFESMNAALKCHCETLASAKGS